MPLASANPFCGYAARLTLTPLHSRTHRTADGYNPLTVAGTNFVVNKPQIEALLNEIGIVDPGNIGMRSVVKNLLMTPWRPGSLFKDFVSVGASFTIDNIQLLHRITTAASQHFAAQFNQNGFWADHWTYILDLVDNYVSVFPDLEYNMLWKERVPFYFR